MRFQLCYIAGTLVASELQLVTSYDPPIAYPGSEWTPGLLRSAEVLADSGHLTLAADLVEYLLGDDRVSAVVATRTGAPVWAPLEFPLSFEATGDGRRSKRVVRALEAQEDYWHMVPEAELQALHAQALLLGVALGELRWTERYGRLVPQLRTWDARWLRFDHPTQAWMLKVQSPKGATEIRITPGDGKWIIFTPFGANRPWARGLYRALSRWVLLKALARRDWATTSERMGQGIKIIAGPNKSRDERKELVAAVRQVGGNGVITLPEGFSVDMLESSAQSYAAFQAQIEACDSAAAITILGASLTTTAASGAGGMAATHQNTTAGRVKLDCEVISTMLRDQVLKPWAAVNFGDAELAPWPVRDASQNSDLKARADTVMQVLQGAANAKNANLPIDIEALLASFSIKTKPVEPVPTPEESA